jgi:hypothetical protein
MRKKFFSRYFLFLFCLFTISACLIREANGSNLESENQNKEYFNESQLPKPTITLSDISPTTLPYETSTTNEEKNLTFHLSYFASSSRNTNVYDVSVSCLEDWPPCFGEPTKIFSIPNRVNELRWSPNGKQFAFSATLFEENDIFFQNDVFISDVDSLQYHNITDTNERLENIIAWSPDSLQIIYDSRSIINPYYTTQPPYVFDLIVSNNKGTEKKNILFSDSILNIISIDWSSDGEWITFTEGSPYQVFTARVEESNLTNLTQITNNEYGCFFPSFSPDGQMLIYICNRRVPGFGGGHTEEDIYLTKLTTGETDIVRSTNSWSFGEPIWAPNGEWVVIPEFLEDTRVHFLKLDGTIYTFLIKEEMRIGRRFSWRVP